MTVAGRHGDPGPPAVPVARALWRLVEPVHAVVYFGDATRDAFVALGLTGFWMGYFAGRFAPLGACSPDVASALAYNFAPSLVSRVLPEAWRHADPAAVIAARADTAAIMLRRLCPDADEVARRSLPLLESAVGAARTEGRALAASNLGLERPTDPVARLFHATTILREHRGDGHVAALVTHGVSGIESHLLAASVESDPGLRAGRTAAVRRARGWTDEEWDRAEAALASRGLLDDDGGATAEGFALHARIESVTDDLAAQPFRDGLTDAGLLLLPTVLRPLALAIHRSGLIPMPNPIGLPPLP